MNRTLLFGWDLPTWERAISWAQSDLKASDIYDEGKRRDFLAARNKWMTSGGPIDGPITELLGASV